MNIDEEDDNSDSEKTKDEDNRAERYIWGENDIGIEKGDDKEERDDENDESSTDE